MKRTSTRLCTASGSDDASADSSTSCGSEQSSTSRLAYLSVSASFSHVLCIVLERSVDDTIKNLLSLTLFPILVTDHVSGPRRAIGPVCACVCVSAQSVRLQCVYLPGQLLTQIFGKLVCLDTTYVKLGQDHRSKFSVRVDDATSSDSFSSFPAVRTPLAFSNNS